jgi:hypothetical protein
MELTSFAFQKVKISMEHSEAQESTTVLIFFLISFSLYIKKSTWPVKGLFGYSLEERVWGWIEPDLILHKLLMELFHPNPLNPARFRNNRTSPKQYKENVWSRFDVDIAWLVPPLNMYPTAVLKKIGSCLLEICDRLRSL